MAKTWSRKRSRSARHRVTGRGCHLAPRGRIGQWLARGTACVVCRRGALVRILRSSSSPSRGLHQERLRMTTSRRTFSLTLGALAAFASLAGMTAAQAADTIKVGILHSLSGTMAISETVLKDTALMTIAEINAKGGVLGKQLEPVVVDPASNWPLFAEKARQLISQDQVAVVFGCWTSRVAQIGAAGVRGTQRPALLPGAVRGRRAVEERVLHGREAPNQQAIARGRIPDEQGRRRKPSASTCWAPTTSTRARPTRSCARSCTRRA